MDNNLPVSDDNQNIVDPNSVVPPATPQPVAPTPVPEPVASAPIQSDMSAAPIDSISSVEGAPMVETVSQVEQVHQVETLSTPAEQLPTPEVPIAPAVAEQPSDQPAPVQPVVQEKTPEEMNVVDKRTSHEQLTSISDTADKLTAEADAEEEDFIKHVEEVHTITQ